MRSLLVCALFVIGACALGRSVLEHGGSIVAPEGWSNTGVRARLNEVREIVVALKQQNLDTLERLFWQRSNPDHKDYGKALSVEEITKLVAPKAGAIKAVRAWLESNGAQEVELHANKDFMLAKVTLGQMETMFGVKFTVWSHNNGKIKAAAFGQYTVPAEIAHHLDLVAGILGLTVEKSRISFASSSTNSPSTSSPSGTSSPSTSTSTSSSFNPPALAITPDVIRTRYQIPTGLVGKNPNNMQAVAEFQAQYFDPTDLVQFFKTYVNYSTADTIEKIVGYNFPSTSPSLEAALDTEYIMGVAPNIKTTFYSMKNVEFYSDIMKWLYKLGNTTDADLPWVHSISYGSQGDYPSNDFQRRADAEFQKLGLRMRSIIFASGDSGSGCQPAGSTSGVSSGISTGTSQGGTSTHSGSVPNSKGSFSSSTGGKTSGVTTATTGGTSGGQGESCTGIQLDPSYPATSIYVTSVGATRFLSGNSGSEGAVKVFQSGGGFSYSYPRPSYQNTAVEAYLSSEKTLPPTTAFNESGRATPDVSALGDEHFQVIAGGQLQAVGGTSCSSPTFAAIISLLNDIRLTAGNSTMGFLNPWIYKTVAAHPETFNDITIGNNVCPTSSGGSSFASSSAIFDDASSTSSSQVTGCGFYCAPGWDPITGVGTPNFSQMKLYV